MRTKVPKHLQFTYSGLELTIVVGRRAFGTVATQFRSYFKVSTTGLVGNFLEPSVYYGVWFTAKGLVG